MTDRRWAGGGAQWRHHKLRMTSLAMDEGQRRPSPAPEVPVVAEVVVGCRDGCSQPIHPEGVLSGRVSQDHVRVIEHV